MKASNQLDASVSFSPEKQIRIPPPQNKKTKQWNDKLLHGKKQRLTSSLPIIFLDNNFDMFFGKLEAPDLGGARLRWITWRNFMTRPTSYLVNVWVASWSKVSRTKADGWMVKMWWNDKLSKGISIGIWFQKKKRILKGWWWCPNVPKASPGIHKAYLPYVTPSPWRTIQPNVHEDHEEFWITIVSG